MADVVICPVCGGSGVVAPDPGEREAFSERIRTASERDQTASDRDQTWSDHDQTASDRDQRSARDDQEAAEADFAAGGDPDLHERTRVARDRTSRDREDIARARDETAEERLGTAAARDRSAERLDQTHEEREAGHHEARSDHDVGDTDVLLRAERDRAIAAADRARAAEDRVRAAADRDEATRQRDQAFLAQAEARRDLLAAATDELTGALTRKFGLESISREIERARRMDDSLTLAIIDVDGLKEVNDQEGHSHGDQLLRRVVDTLRANVRAYDVIVRYGGDEFLCALPHLKRDIAGERMQKVAAVLSAADARHSIGFGLAEYDPGEGIDTLVDRADTELLLAKHAEKRDE